MEHLNALELRLSHERCRLRQERSKLGREIRQVWIAQIEKEIAAERKFIEPAYDLTDDELLAALTS